MKAISRLTVTDANYKIALKTLIDRFQNKREIVNSCLKSFVNQKPMKNRSADEVRSIIDNTKESLLCIGTLGIHTDEWDPFIVFMVQSLFA